MAKTTRLTSTKPSFLEQLAAPARRALVAKGLTTLKKLSAWSRAEVSALHGVGKTAIPYLERSLSAAGLSFRKLRPGTPETVQDYIESHPPQVVKRLRQLRSIILKAAPDVDERIGYGMPYYKLNGPLVYYAAHLNHIGLYPMPSAIKRFKNRLVGFKFAAGSIQFPNSESFPLDLIGEIIRFRVSENRLKK